jgi:hypothetical protein
MPRIILVSATLLGACVSFTAWAGGPPQAKTLLLVAELTDDEIAGQLIKQSIAVYPGSCPCPYHADRAGRTCGKRSAYSKPGGASPLCFRSDVTAEMVRAWRAKMSASAQAS